MASNNIVKFSGQQVPCILQDTRNILHRIKTKKSNSNTINNTSSCKETIEETATTLYTVFNFNVWDVGHASDRSGVINQLSTSLMIEFVYVINIDVEVNYGKLKPKLKI